MTEDEFQTFWKAYPLKIARGAAKTALARALKKTDMQAILNAIQIYIRCKPEDRAWCHASTWLNQERWADEWEPPETIKPEPIVRSARNLEELKQYLAEVGKPVARDILTAKTIDELPTFLRMIPAAWKPANVTPLRRA